MKRSSKCEIECLKSNYHKNKDMSDNLHSQCISCGRIFYNEILVKIKQYYWDNGNRKKEYYLKNCDKISIRHNEYIKNRLKTDVHFRSFHNTRRRIHHALNGKLKSSSTMDILGIGFIVFRKWIEIQMTPDMNWKSIDIDHVEPFSAFDTCDEEQSKEAFNWKNTQPLLEKVHQQKGVKFNLLDYRLQLIKAYQLLKLNEKSLN